MVPKSSGMYATYEIVRRELAGTHGFGDATWVSGVAGLFSGVSESFIVTPTQVVKVHDEEMQFITQSHN